MAEPKDKISPQPQSQAPSQKPQSLRSTLFGVPAPIRRLFNHFPLRTYPPNELPSRCATTRTEENVPVLYIFADWESAEKGAPSYHPSCLKWQTYLKMSNIEFTLHPSTNHASPSGSLPYLETPASSGPIPASKLRTHIARLPGVQPAPPSPPEAAPHASLIDHPIRRAYLHALYLSRENTPLLTRLYLAPATKSLPVRSVLLRQLRSAAEDEILASGGGYTASAIDVEDLYGDAEEALRALDSLLGGGEWFFGGGEEGGRKRGPTEFDAAVFAYTHVLLDDNLGWRDTRLGDLVRKCEGLVRHRGAMLLECWPERVRSG